MKKPLLAFVLILVCAVILAGCSNEKETIAEFENKTVVAVSIVPQKTFVEAVCGDLVDVVTLIPPGSSPANYEPTPLEMEQFSKASIYFTIGVPTEEANILHFAQQMKNLKIIKLQEEVARIYSERTFASGGRDPHLWLSPKRVQVMLKSIVREMSELDAENKDIYAENAREFSQELDELDAQIKSVLANVKNRKFIAFHPSFGYLADDYGLEMYALEEDGKEATPRRLQEMIDFAKLEDIKVIFYQAEINSKQAAAFAEEIGGKTVQLAPLAPNYIENLQEMAASMAEVMR
ncbi:MAG: ABC transporter substrate-binding protein [Firmicutes bacterium HGW-Firmicutes-12]|nr:MAG: ABC transporter substrate-binding protein [Firmicutes bacterium HGW-Firmicutes-12]